MRVDSASLFKHDWWVKKTEAENYYDSVLLSDEAQARQSWERLSSMLAGRDVRFRETLLPASIKPHFVAADIYRTWVEKTERLFATLERVAASILANSEWYDALQLPAASRTLIDIDPGYSRVGVICRTDMVWQGDFGENLSTYEINADSPAMMTFTDYIEQAQRELFPLNGMLQDFSIGEENRTRILLDALVGCYKEWGGSDDGATIAIVDWPNQKTKNEQEATANEFTRMGHPSFVCHPHELKIADGRLLGRGRPIDIVHRRVLFPEFLARPDEVSVLLQAYRDGLVCMVNPLRSYILGNKMLMALLSSDRFWQTSDLDARVFLSNILLDTKKIDDELRSFLSKDAPEKWVLKAALGHGGHEVEIGHNLNEDEWAQALERTLVGPWVAQTYEKPPRLEVPNFEMTSVSPISRWCNWNPFVFGGKFAGGMTRVSSSEIVSITANGALLPAVSAVR